jgi:hypothetical protein
MSREDMASRAKAMPPVQGLSAAGVRERGVTVRAIRHRFLSFSAVSAVRSTDMARTDSGR